MADETTEEKSSEEAFAFSGRALLWHRRPWKDPDKEEDVEQDEVGAVLDLAMERDARLEDNWATEHMEAIASSSVEQSVKIGFALY
jgi:hypothetical protein